MPDTDLPLERLAAVRDVGITHPDLELLRARVRTAIDQEIVAATDSPSVRRRSVRPARRVPRLGAVVASVSTIVSVAIAVAAIALLSHHHDGRPGGNSGSEVQIVYRIEPTPQTPVVTRAAVARALDVVRARLIELHVSGATIRAVGRDEISVRLRDAKNVALVIADVGTTARLEFYDWEANALVLPAGGGRAETVASQLSSGDRAALAISQAGGGPPGTGSAAAGAVGLYEAVKLASTQPYSASPRNSRLGSEYFLFGAPGSTACAAAASAAGGTVTAGQHCLLAGGFDVSLTTSRSSAIQGLEQGLSRVERDAGEILVVKQGTVVLQAAPNSFSAWPAYGSAAAGYYVLRDNVALFGNEITHLRQSTASTGQPDVTFDFTRPGAAAFQNLTAAIATRGALDSIAGGVLDQHFAVAIDNQLITVPSIDYKTYPDGISGNHGADLALGSSPATAQRLAAELRLDGLAVNLKQISTSNS